MKKLIVSPSPHIRDYMTTSKIMMHVIIALIPSLIVATVVFGVRALTLTAFCILTAVIWERLCNLVMKRANSTGDLSAAVTGILLAFNLPVTIPYWIAAIGTFIAIVIVKQLFGGIGHNFANPAIVARIVLMLSFPVAMSQWVKPFYDAADVVTEATPLVSGNAEYSNMFFGIIGGSLGEVSKSALLIGAMYLLALRIIQPHAPLAFIGTVFLFSFATGRDPLYQILAGGIILGAFFMATDYVTTPITNTGKIIFGIGCGVITCVIRFWCSSPEGVSYSILLMNILTPYIDMFTRSKPVGAKRAIETKEVQQ